jgi:hypothetical protein
MIESMKRTLVTSALAFALGVAAAPAQQVPEPPEVASVAELVRLIQQREKTVESVAIAMRTKGTFPGEAGFETTGTLRVLDATHFHSSMRVGFGDGMSSEFETLRTPDGVVMRESDPAQGEVFVRMDQALVADLESASKALGQAAGTIGVGAPDLSAGPLGSVMLEDLAAQFDLQVSAPRPVGEAPCWVVQGPRRADLSDDQAAFGPADQVDLVVRCADLAVIRMTQLAAGKPIVEVEILSLVVDQPMDPTSFSIAIPEKARVVAAMDHPPARAQIERVFAEAEAKGWTRPAASEAQAPRGEETTGR